MNIFQMKCLVVLARSSTFHEAAEELYISQSSFSNNIQTIEKEFNVKLILRGTRGFALTEEGRTFLSHAEKIVEEYERMTGLLAEYKNTAESRVNIYADDMSSYGYSDLLVESRLYEPDIQIKITEISGEGIIDILRADETAAGIIFTRKGARIPGITRRTIMQDRFVAAVGKNHKFLGVRSLKMQDLKSEELQIVSRKQSKFLYDFVVQMCENAGFFPKLSPYTVWYNKMVQTANQKGLVAIVPENVAKTQCPPDMTLIEISDSEPFFLDIAVSAKCTHSAALRVCSFANRVKKLREK